MTVFEMVRRTQKVTQKDLAEKAGLSIATVCRVEKGNLKPSCRFRKAISEAMNIEEDILFPEYATNGRKKEQSKVVSVSSLKDEVTFYKAEVDCLLQVFGILFGNLIGLVTRETLIKLLEDAFNDIRVVNDTESAIKEWVKQVTLNPIKELNSEDTKKKMEILAVFHKNNYLVN